MADEKFEIVKANDGDIVDLHNLLEIAGIRRESGYFEICLEEQKNNARDVLLARRGDGRLAGFVMLNWRPLYAFYRRMGIPEIQDLNVIPEARRQGVAMALVRYCEDLARMKGCAQAGIAVGLDSGYGAAQRLYVKLGYMPDGFGITYDRHPVSRGEVRPIDDDLCLMMVKELGI